MKWAQFINNFIKKVYTRRTNDEAVVLQSCFLDVLPRHTNIMPEKGFNLFDKCATRCVNLSLQEEECSSSSWGDIKMYTSGSIANSKRVLAEINKSGAKTKIRIWLERNTVKHLKAFRIIFRAMQISLLILSWLCFSCLVIQRFF